MEYIFLSGEIGWELTPKTLQAEFDKLDTDEVTIYVNSVGGGVFDAVAMYDYLKLKQTQGIDIHTVGTGVTASAGTLIALAGKKSTRKVHNTTTYLVHESSHGAIGNQKDLEKAARETKVLNNKMAEIYEAETNLTKQEALDLMALDESSNADYLVEKGFASEIIKYEAVANIRTQINNKQKKMTNLTKDDKGWIQSTITALVNQFKPTAKVVQDADGKDLDFYELEADAEIKVGDKARFDGSDAEGEYTMPNADVYVFEAGELTEIKMEDEADEAEALKQEVADLKQKLADAEAKTEAEATAHLEAVAKIETDFTAFKNELETKFNYTGKPDPKENQVERINLRK